MGDLLDPLALLAGTAAKVAVDSWTTAMLSLWNAGLWVLRLAFLFTDFLLTPDLSEQGAGATLYRSTFWIAGTLALIMGLVQLGVIAFRRDGKSLARLAIGYAQFTVAWAGWLAYAATVVTASGGLTRALMGQLLAVDSWRAFQPWTPITPADLGDATVATVLGLLGIVVWLAAIGHFLVFLARAAALLVLVATAPIAAAGLVSDVGRAWFWKSLRWFHAAALAPVVMVLVLGVCIQFTAGVALGDSRSVFGAVGTAVPGVILICVATVSPLALFKLLSFVDPGTTSGAALRTTLGAFGGLQGALGGGGSTAAQSADANGRSSGEDGAADATSSRFTQAAQTGLGALGPVGGALAAGLGMVAAVGSAGASVGADLTNQMGVGHNTYPPDYVGRAQRAARAENQTSPDADGQNADGQCAGGPDAAGPTPPTGQPTPPDAAGPAPAPSVPAFASPGSASPGGAGGSTTAASGSTGAAAGGSAGTGSAAAAAVVV